MTSSPQPSPDGKRRHGRDSGASGPLAAVLDIHRLLVESVQGYAIFVLDPEGHIATWNPGAERVTGYRAEEIVGKHFSIFYPRAEIERDHPAYELRVAQAEGRYEEEGWRLRKDGTPFWSSVTIAALRDDEGVLVGFAKVTRDLTDRKKAEEELRQSEERFRLLVQGVQDYGIFMLDPGGHIASWNEGAQRINGWATEEILGRHFSIFYPAEDLAWDKPEMELRVASEEGRFEDEGWRVRKDGSRFWSNVVITALRNPAGELIGFAKVTRDLTARRAAEQRAIEDARRVAEAETANRAKSEFLAAMSHELRTPLNAIAGYIDLLAYGVHGPLNEAQRGALERVRASQRHLLTLINDLLNFSRIEAGRITYRIAAVDLAGLLAEVAPMVEPQARERGIAVSWEPSRDPVVARADPARVEQIVLNLVTNAVKYTDPGGSVGVRHFTSGERAVIEVSDTGIGIPPQFIEAIFEPFTQVGRSLRSSHDGAGLGLAISRDLARAMKGDITVDSTVGEGSTFTLSLPAGV